MLLLSDVLPEKARGPVKRSSPEHSLTPPDETPIEREIRLALRREHSLRRSRGLDAMQDKAKEFVEIPSRRSVLSQDLTLKSRKSEGKERNFAGKKMQREILLEAEREKVLVQLGKLPGFYDKGTVRQLREKKLLFEAFQEPKEFLTAQSKSPASLSCQEISGSEDSEISGSHTERGLSQESLFQSSVPTPLSRDGGFSPKLSGARGPSLIEAVRGQVIILENSPSATARTPGQEDRPPWGETVVDSGCVKPLSTDPSPGGRVQNQEASDDEKSNDDKESAVLKENPFFKLRSSLSMRPDVQQDIWDTRERERELHRQRISLYGRGSESKGTKTPTSPDSKASSPQQPQKTSPTPTSAQHSHGKLDLTWPPPPPQQEQNECSEAQKSPKMPLQRSSLLELWESGLANGHGSPRD
ncbi:muscle M-line assembly protein unc-89 [Electrophorus electricus]|uniref:muscle M-line assembly protein unc-89 n=1 Tax=Electrophorus electricus TaxID=8005 RepID=UPI0015D0A0AA|nr:muscle M-line assembly protein unc-89 [Electrophorus electricus]